VLNNGIGTAHNVIVDVDLPGGTHLRSDASSPGFGEQAGSSTCRYVLGDLDGGTSVNLKLAFTVPESTPIDSELQPRVVLRSSDGGVATDQGENDGEQNVTILVVEEKDDDEDVLYRAYVPLVTQ
jgi:hypothetical protein